MKNALKILVIVYKIKLTEISSKRAIKIVSTDFMPSKFPKLISEDMKRNYGHRANISLNYFGTANIIVATLWRVTYLIKFIIRRVAEIYGLI